MWSLFLWAFFFKIPHINEIIQHLSFSKWLISLSIMPSSFIHVVTNITISFSLWLYNIPLHLDTVHLLYAFRLTLRVFPCLGNIMLQWTWGCRYLFMISFPLNKYPEVGIAMDGEAWWATVHGVTKSWTRLSDFTFTFHFHALEKEMATYSSVLAWRIPGMGEPGGLPSMGSHRVGHDWSNLAAAAW